MRIDVRAGAASSALSLLIAAVAGVVGLSCGGSGGKGRPPDGGTGMDAGLPVPAPTFEAETMTAVDPRPGSQLAYAVTIESILANGPGPTGKCIIRKQVHVYRSMDFGRTWTDMPGNDRLPHATADWLTDPDISVGVDGTLYLTVMLGHSAADCATPQNTDTRAIQLWFAPPPGEDSDPGLQPAFTGNNAALASTTVSADHPQIAASGAVPGQVVVSSVAGDALNANRPFVATFERTAAGLYAEVGARIATDGFQNLAFDGHGHLYVATGNLFDILVRRFERSGGQWTESGSGTMPVAANRRHLSGVNVPSNPGVRILGDITPGLAAATLPGSTSSTVFISVEVSLDGSGVGNQLQVASASEDNLTAWTVRLLPQPAGSISTLQPGLSADGPGDRLDLVAYSLRAPTPLSTAAPPPDAFLLRTILYRFTASTLVYCAGPTTLNGSDATTPRVSQLPARHSHGTGLFNDNDLFAGEYQGLATKDQTAVVAWPERAAADPTNVNVDLGRAALAVACTPQAPCPGSGLTDDPLVASICPPPSAPIPGCTTGGSGAVSQVMTLPSTPGFEAQTALAIDPRNDNVAYAAVVEATTASGPGPTGTCITGKRLRVLKSTDKGGSWSPMVGSENLPQGQWVTEPKLSVGGDGTLYLAFLRTRGAPDCNTDPDFSLVDAQLWFAAAPQAGTDPPLQKALAAGASPFGDDNPAVAGTTAETNHVQLAANPKIPGQVVVVVNTASAPSSAVADSIVTYQRNAAGTVFAEVNRTPFNVAGRARNAVVDERGELYVATGGVPFVERHSWTGSTWRSGTGGRPSQLGGGTVVDEVAIASTPPVALFNDGASALAVATLGNTTTPVVYSAFDIGVSSQNRTRQVQLNVANSDDLSGTRWRSQLVSIPADATSSFHAGLGIDGPNNTVDLVLYDLLRAGEATEPALPDLSLRTTFYRFDAGRFETFIGPLAVSTNPPRLSDLPAIDSTVARRSTLSIGELLGIATKGTVTAVGWPERNAAAGGGPGAVDVGLATVTATCNSPLFLVDPDATWRCACNCGGAQPTVVVGCASSGATSAAAACAEVCGASPCGDSLTCAASTCTGTGSGTMLSAASCALSDGRPAGAPPASRADYVATASAASTSVIRVGGSAATTAVPGQAILNVTTSPPIAGAGLEIALFDVHPADVFVGGGVDATVRNITVVHPARIKGVFIDGKRFRIDAGKTGMVLTFQTQPAGGPPSAPLNVVGANAAPITGTLDLAAGTFVLDGTLGDSAGNSLELRFRGTITSRPADANGNGIIDAVDKCPGATVGPDRAPPLFTFVPPAVTITRCRNVSIGQAAANDPCGVTISNNAPATFPLGTTVVTWTARDNAGNAARAIQVVTAVLGDDTSCCPAGARVVVGTSNNDVLTGTAGSDCILGRGGQDRISGGGGDDFISGGDGDDTIFGEDGNDRLYGGAGQDVVSGGNGHDFADGGDGVDTLNGDGGNDTLTGGQGGDQLLGGIGNDVLSGGADDDRLFGGDGNDRLSGGPGNDTLKGESGDDNLAGENGDDSLDGGPGTDSLNGGSGNNICVDGSAIACLVPTH